MIGDSATGSWLKTPMLYNPPAPGLGLGKAGPFIDGVWQITGSSAPLATFKIHISLVRDQVRFQLTTVNTAATSQSIGVAMEGDTMVEDTIRSDIRLLRE